MRSICLIATSILWILHAVGVHGDNFSLIWLGAAFIPLAFALDGVSIPWRKAP